MSSKPFNLSLFRGSVIHLYDIHLVRSRYYPTTNLAAVPPNPASGQLNHDWFEFARERGATMLWVSTQQMPHCLLRVHRSLFGTAQQLLIP